MKTFSEDGLCFVDMEHSFTINEVETFKTDLLPLLSTDKEFMIHCIDLTEIDSAGLQMLISLKKQLQKENIIFEITAGTRLKEYISFFHLDEYFKEDLV